MTLHWAQHEHVLEDMDCLTLYQALVAPNGRAGWAFSASSTASDHHLPFTRHWQTFIKCGHEPSEVADERLPGCSELLRRCERLLDRGPLTLQRVYVNGYTAGQFPCVHQDDAREGYFTALLFLNPTWQVDWHGETLLYDQRAEEVIHCCLPRAGRVLFFDSRIWHGANAPSLICPEIRLTLALKFSLACLQAPASDGSAGATHGVTSTPASKKDLSPQSIEL